MGSRPDDEDASVTRAARGELSDRQLLNRHVAGDGEAFGEIVARHRDRLWAVALRTLGDPEEAADAVQDALVSALRGARTYRGEAEVTTWLHRVVVNACLDRIRRGRARPSVPLPDDDHGLGASGLAAPDLIARRELSLVLIAALATLPEDQRVAIVLVDVHGYPVEEAARILGCPVGTVKSRCARGRLRLRPLLAGAREGRADDEGPGSGNPEGPPRVSPPASTGGEGR